MRITCDKNGAILHLPSGEQLRITNAEIDRIIATRNEFLREQRHRGY